MLVLHSALALVILWPADGKLGFFQTSQGGIKCSASPCSGQGPEGAGPRGEGEGAVCSLLNMLLTTRGGNKGWQKQLRS